MPQDFPTRRTNLAAASKVYERNLKPLQGDPEFQPIPGYLVERVYGNFSQIGYAVLLKPLPEVGGPSILAIRGSHNLLSGLR
ncbi:MAG: hypothetical protein FJX35_24170 [Alphaproteobacteria bacterium]|nr:hypothetical protein [Alphaproteobacteria bacterium]